MKTTNWSFQKVTSNARYILTQKITITPEQFQTLYTAIKQVYAKTKSPEKRAKLTIMAHLLYKRAQISQKIAKYLLKEKLNK